MIFNKKTKLKMSKFNSLFISIFLLVIQNITAQEDNYVILVSFDGFRWD